MVNDPIVEEVRRVREAYAARFNYDVEAIFRDLLEKEKASGRTYVSYPPRTVEPAPVVPAPPVPAAEAAR